MLLPVHILGLRQQELPVLVLLQLAAAALAQIVSLAVAVAD
jgi:hypothetical protein